jgi:hypothetical protein
MQLNTGQESGRAANLGGLLEGIRQLEECRFLIRPADE